MDISFLKEFAALSKYESFEKTAEALYTTQSTLSKHIQKMEKELGVTLFDRTTRRVQISECGKVLLRYALEIEALESQYLRELNAYKQVHTHNIRIKTENVSSYRIANHKLMDTFLLFQKEHQDYTLDIGSGKMFEVYDQLIDGSIDFAVFRYHEGIDMSPFDVLSFAEDSVVAILSKQNPFALRKAVSLYDLRDEKFLLSTKKSFMYNLIVNSCKDLGFTPNLVPSDSHMKETIQLAALNMGIYFCMKRPSRDYRNPNAVSVNLDPPFKCKIALCCRKGKLSPPAREFWQFMKHISGNETAD